MVKTLIFYWYVSEDDWHWSYDVHLNNLERYKNCFDKQKFIFSYNEDEVNRTTLKKIVTKVKEIFPKADIEQFTNDKEYREARYFYNDIAEELSSFKKNEVIFFAHARGRYTEYTETDEETKYWINMQYFGCLEHMNKVEEYLSDKTSCCVGTLCQKEMKIKDTSKDDDVYVRVPWVYLGAFYWFVPIKIYLIMKERNVELPEISRWFVENWLGCVIPDSDKYRKAIPGIIKFREGFFSYVERTFSEEDKLKFNELYG